MERLGKVIEWNDERGFGFIQPQASTGERLFFHIRDYRQDGRRPEVGEWVKYRPERQPDGRGKAGGVRRAAAAKAKPAPRPRRTGRVPGVFQAALVVAYAALLAWAVDRDRLPVEFVLGLAILSAATWVAYALDKDAARRGRWRIAENTLHLMELLGGWPGAIAAQQRLRHKTLKRSFRWEFWSMVCLHLAGLLTWLFWPR